MHDTQPTPHVERRIEFDDSGVEWLDSAPHNFEILACILEGEMQLGVQSADSSPAHHDVLPEELYDELVVTTSAAVDDETLEATVTAEDATTVGHCTIHRESDTTVQVTLELVGEFVET